MLILDVHILSSHVLMCRVNIQRVRATWQVSLQQDANEVKIPGPVSQRWSTTSLKPTTCYQRARWPWATLIPSNLTSLLRPTTLWHYTQHWGNSQGYDAVAILEFTVHQEKQMSMHLGSSITQERDRTFQPLEDQGRLHVKGFSSSIKAEYKHYTILYRLPWVNMGVPFSIVPVYWELPPLTAHRKMWWIHDRDYTGLQTEFGEEKRIPDKGMGEGRTSQKGGWVGKIAGNETGRQKNRMQLLKILDALQESLDFILQPMGRRIGFVFQQDQFGRLLRWWKNEPGGSGANLEPIATLQARAKDGLN